MPEESLLQFLDALLGFSDLAEDVDDSVVEGAITLMEKLSHVLEDYIHSSKKADKLQKFQKIIERLTRL